MGDVPVTLCTVSTTSNISCGAKGTGYPNTNNQVPDWLLPFDQFGNWLLSVGKGINDFLNTLGNVYAQAVAVSGEHPLGVVMLIVFFLALVAIFIFLPKL